MNAVVTIVAAGFIIYVAFKMFGPRGPRGGGTAVVCGF